MSASTAPAHQHPWSARMAAHLLKVSVKAKPVHVITFITPYRVALALLITSLLREGHALTVETRAQLCHVLMSRLVGAESSTLG